jgi:ABC-type transport system involved in multi-copper enzyme maturation permease subunit
MEAVNTMKRTLLVARTEVLEHLRQSWMLFVLAFNYIFWIVIFMLAFRALAFAQSNPQAIVIFEKNATGLGLCSGESAFEALVRVAVSSYGTVLFTNLPLFSAIMSGYSVLHERTCGTLPFLMLAPLSRYQLVLGKLVGVMVLPTILHFVFVGSASYAASQLPVISSQSDKFGGAPAWWVAFLLGGPAAAFLMGSLGTVISGLSKDVRTSMQFTSFLMGILGLGIGFVLIDGIRFGIGLQVTFVIGSILTGLITLLIGSRIISRDFA